MLKSTKLKNTLLVGATTILVSCGGQKEIKMGSYAYDAQFLKDHGIEYTELVSADGNSKVMVIPAWQGRVMTTSASGDEGDSYGWINYRFINEGKVSSQFNPVGGEERFWLGPEGGPFSLYFKEGQEQVYDNWIVPPVLDTEAFDMDNGYVEVWFTDGNILRIKCEEVEADLRTTEQSLAKLHRLLDNKPIEYVAMALSGEMQAYCDIEDEMVKGMFGMIVQGYLKKGYNRATADTYRTFGQG